MLKSQYEDRKIPNTYKYALLKQTSQHSYPWTCPYKNNTYDTFNNGSICTRNNMERSAMDMHLMYGKPLPKKI